MRALIVGLVCWVSSCLTSCAPMPVLPARWEWRPVQVLISEKLTPACQTDVANAIDFWGHHGAGYLVPQTVQADDPRLLLPGLGVVTVTDRVPERAGSAAASYVASVGGVMASAEIRLGRTCTLWHAAHELGHSLGLADADAPSNVMHRSDGHRQFGVTPAQLDRIQ